MIYSRLLHTAEEQPHNEDGEGGYTIFNNLQILDVDDMCECSYGIQQFAVLWDGEFDPRIIYSIERAIIIDQFSPVILLHATEGTLTVVHRSDLESYDYEEFTATWEAMAAAAPWDYWTLEMIRACDVFDGLQGGRLLRCYAPEILNSRPLGVMNFTEDMTLIDTDWEDGPEPDLQEQDDDVGEPPEWLKIDDDWKPNG